MTLFVPGPALVLRTICRDKSHVVIEFSQTHSQRKKTLFSMFGKTQSQVHMQVLDLLAEFVWQSFGSCLTLV